jgi:hypothetical protein
MKRITLITFGLSIAACTSSPSPSTPATAADYEDAAQTISSSMVTSGGNGGHDGGGGAGLGVSGGDAIVFADAVSLARGRLPLGFIRQDEHHCHGNLQGVDHAFTITCKDAAGTELAKCDSTTDSATITLKQTGDLTTPNLTASVDREGTFTITGLQSATATLNGNSSFSLDTTLTSIFHQGVTSSFTLDATATYDAITVATADRQVTGGKASFDLQTHRTVTGTDMGSHDVDKTVDIHADLTFNGDGTATLVLDGAHTFTINLKTGRCNRAG